MQEEEMGKENYMTSHYKYYVLICVNFISMLTSAYSPNMSKQECFPQNLNCKTKQIFEIIPHNQSKDMYLHSIQYNMD